VCRNATGEDVSSTMPITSISIVVIIFFFFGGADAYYSEFRMIQIALRVLLKKTKRFEVKGPLEYARMPEMGIISCPLTISI
jgi:hypothetical protein